MIIVGYVKGQDIRFINGKLRKVKLDNKGKIIDHNKIIVDEEFKNMAKRPVTDRLIDVNGKLVTIPDEDDQNKDKNTIKNSVVEHKEKDSTTEKLIKIDKNNEESIAKDKVKEVKEVKKESITATKAKKGGKIMEEETPNQVYTRREKEKEDNERQNEIHSFVEKACSGVDCLKNDMSNMSKDIGDTNKRLDYIAKKIEEDKSYPCEKCGESRVKAFSSYCPNCNSPIYEWTDSNGKPISGWIHFSKRMEAMKEADKASKK